MKIIITSPAPAASLTAQYRRKNDHRSLQDNEFSSPHYYLLRSMKEVYLFSEGFPVLMKEII